MSTHAKAYAAASATSPLAPLTIPRRAPGDTDVEIDILYCGVCHSDLHQARNEWQSVMPTSYPCVVGHEIIGRVMKVGGKVDKFKVGDLAGVGCMVDSCRTCPSCTAGDEQFCQSGATFTYNSPDKHTGKVTYGGYSERMVVDQAFALKVSEKLDPAGAAPLLCAGITTWSPLKRAGIGKGHKVGVVGLGGLGHMGVKIAKAMGATVVVFTSSKSKLEDAKRLGADEVLLSTDAGQMKTHAFSFDFILDTVSAVHDLNTYLGLLKVDGTMTLVGAPDEPTPVAAFALLFGRKRLAGSLIGGINETQEMLDFCAAHGITADVEVIPVQQVNEAYERLLKGDVQYRFVLDISTIR